MSEGTWLACLVKYTLMARVASSPCNLRSQMRQSVHTLEGKDDAQDLKIYLKRSLGTMGSSSGGDPQTATRP